MRLALGLCAALSVTAFAFTALLRAAYPFELEWMEGGSLDHVRWLLSGHRLYVRPTLDFIPFIYTPVYYYITAALSRCFGPSFLLLRLTSIVATFLTTGLLHRLLRYETGDRFASFMGASFYLATYRLSWYWFDVGRVDSTCILFLTAAVYVTRSGKNIKSAALAGALLSLAFLTKQVAMVAALPLGLYLLHSSIPRFLSFLVATLVVAGGGFIWLNWIHDGWFYYYIITLPAAHDIEWRGWLGFWTHDLRRLAPMPVLFLIAGWAARRRSPSSGAVEWFYGPLAITLVGVSYLARLHAGGSKNVIMPAFMVASLCFGLAIHVLGELAPGHGEEAVGDVPAKRLQSIGYALGIVQLLALFYLPWRQIPSADDRREGQAFIDLLRRLPGEVYVIDHGYYSSLVGKRTFAQGMALGDVVRGDSGPARQELVAQVDDAVAKQRFGAIIVGTVVPASPGEARPQWERGIHLEWPPPGFVQALERYYVPEAYLYPQTRAFTPLVGWTRRPCVVYVPRTIFP
ncbi:MAG: glycosyltransferase family 39 protein [Polyangiaceae bacterium]